MKMLESYDTKHYNGDVCHSDEQDEPVLRNLKIECPKCGRVFAAMLSKYTDYFGLGNTVSEEQAHTIYKTMCYKCKTTFAFSVDWE